MKLNYLKTIILNNIFIIAISIILLLLSINIYYITIFYLLFLIYVFKKEKALFYIIIFINIFILIIFIFLKIYQNYLITDFNGNIKGKIIEIDSNDYYQKITIKYKLYKVIILDYDYINLKIGDIINIEGQIKEIEDIHIPYAFDYKKYLLNNLYLYQIKSNKITLIKHQFSIYKISEIVNNYLEYFFDNESLIILKGFILGDTSDFNDTLNEALKINGIIHLFAISGSHIILIISFLDKLLNKNKHKNIIINIILFIYLLITKFSVSISRAVFTYYLKCLCDYKKYNINSIDRSSIVFIIFIIINPYFMYNIGFVLSFLSTFLIILISSFLKNKNNITSIIVITLFINLFTLPIIINMNNEINILSPLINVFMILIVEGILIPLSFIVAVFPIFNIGYTYIISGFIKFNEIISDISYKSGLVIIIEEIPIILVVIYYLLIFSIIIVYKNKRFLKFFSLLFIMFLSILLLNIKMNRFLIITFLDLYIGEATLIEYKNEVILIDTGEGINNEVSLFLKNKGIRKIDYLVITHNHSDHNGEAKNIIKYFNVTNIVLNTYDNSEFSNYNNCIKLKQGLSLKTKHMIFYCLSPNKYNQEENNNSLVLYTEIEEYKFLFTGDIQQEIEKELPSLEIDILKIAHHGSNTSSSIEFLQKVNPKYCVIMSGRSNMYEFPSNEVITRLNKLNINILCTKDKYTIILKINKNKCIIKSLK